MINSFKLHLFYEQNKVYTERGLSGYLKTAERIVRDAKSRSADFEHMQDTQISAVLSQLVSHISRIVNTIPKNTDPKTVAVAKKLMNLGVIAAAVKRKFDDLSKSGADIAVKLSSELQGKYDMRFESTDPMSAFAKGAKPERKVGRLKAWISLLDKLEGENPFEEFDYTRKVKSSIPKAHWYFVGGKPMCKMSRSERQCRASLVYLVTDEGILIGEVYEDTMVPKGYYGRWQSGSHTTDNFADAKRYAESKVSSKLAGIERDRQIARAQGIAEGGSQEFRSPMRVRH